MKNKINQRVKTITFSLMGFLITSPLWAMGRPPASGGEGQAPAGGGASLFVPMILVFVIFYFLLIRPQSKQQKKLKEMVSNLKKDDEVITNAGIHGQIVGLTDNVVTLEIANNVRIKMERGSIGRLKEVAQNSQQK